MRLRDLKIKTLLVTILTILLVFIIVFGFFSFYQTTKLWQNTSELYNHPLQVRRALGEFRSDILSIQNSLQNLVLSASKDEEEKAIQNISTYEANAYKQLDTLYALYLGPASDIDITYNNFVSWKAVRDETIRIHQSGNTEEAAGRTKDTGIEGTHFNNLLNSLNAISVFSLNKGDEFFNAAQLLKNNFTIQLSIILALAIIFSSALLFFLYRAIRKPLEELGKATNKFSQGDYGARSAYSSANEFGTLSSAFNNLAEVIENETSVKKDITDISDLMIKSEELDIFCREFLKEIVRKTDSQTGAFYLLDDDKKKYVLYKSVGLSEKAKKSFGADENEGELGLAVSLKQINHIVEIPEDAVLSFSTATGDFLPREIITIPVVSENEVIAVISLASIKNYSESDLKLLNGIWVMANTRISGLLATYKTHEFAKKLELQNLELEHQSKELSVQKDELSQQNTELELQKNQLDETSRLKSTFLSNMSHELRTPLNSIIALSGVLSRRLSKSIPEEEYDYIEIIERSGRNLLSLINDLLDLSRIEAGKEDLNISAFKVEELINLVYEIIEPQAQEKNIDMYKNIQSDLPVIFSDFKKCQSVLQNIAANAVKFTESGSVEISAALIEDMIYIKVKDTGIGIVQENLTVIFDEFRQADDSSSRRYEGTGLGLSIAKKYITMLQGDILVESAPAIGSVFTIKLPVKISNNYEADKAQAQYREIKNNLSGGSLVSFEYNNKTILIVEDSEPAIIQLQDILENQGYKINIARNAKEALENIEKILPNAVVLDLMMPDVDGFEILKNIRSKEKTALIPVLILTAKHITKEELSFLKGNNIYELIQKGDISKDNLLKAIKNMILDHIAKNIKSAVKNKSLKKYNMLKKSEKAKILIVEDNPDNMKTIKALLGDRFIIFEAADGQSGFEQAKLNIPDLILLDISLPVMDGFQVLDAIRNEKKLKNIPVFAVTASAMKGSREEILSYGFDSYISKPVDEKILLEAMEEAIFEK